MSCCRFERCPANIAQHSHLLRGCVGHAHAQIRSGYKYIRYHRHMVQNIHSSLLFKPIIAKCAWHCILSDQNCRCVLPHVTISFSPQSGCQLQGAVEG